MQKVSMNSFSSPYLRKQPNFGSKFSNLVIADEYLPVVRKTIKKSLLNFYETASSDVKKQFFGKGGFINPEKGKINVDRLLEGINNSLKSLGKTFELKPDIHKFDCYSPLEGKTLDLSGSFLIANEGKVISPSVLLPNKGDFKSVVERILA